MSQLSSRSPAIAAGFREGTRCFAPRSGRIPNLGCTRAPTEGPFELVEVGIGSEGATRQTRDAAAGPRRVGLISKGRRYDAREQQPVLGYMYRNNGEELERIRGAAVGSGVEGDAFPDRKLRPQHRAPGSTSHRLARRIRGSVA